jgi:hypothetical protein
VPWLFGALGRNFPAAERQASRICETGEMTTGPRRVGYRMACGLAAIITTVLPTLASESPASAAADAHSRHVPHAVETRDIRHERHIQGIRETRGAEQARKARAAVRPWAITVPSIGVAANLVPLGAPDGSAGPDALSLPVPPLAKAATETGWYQFTAVPGAAGCLLHGSAPP